MGRAAYLSPEGGAQALAGEWGYYGGVDGGASAGVGPFRVDAKGLLQEGSVFDVRRWNVEGTVDPGDWARGVNFYINRDQKGLNSGEGYNYTPKRTGFGAKYRF